MAYALKQYLKIPIHVVEEHNDALQHIYAAIGAKKLPVEGTTLVHIDAHPDLLISRDLRGAEARGGRGVLPLLEIENWIVPAAAAGHLARVLWLRPPWARQMADGSRTVRVGDDPRTGLLRIDSKEHYYLSDALYCSKLDNAREFTLSVAELGDPECRRPDEEQHVTDLAASLAVAAPYVLDIDLDFFSTGNPFLSLYKNIDLYDKLESVFGFEPPREDTDQAFDRATANRELQLQELESLFRHLEEHGSLKEWKGVKTDLFLGVSDLAEEVVAEAARLGEPPDWWSVYTAGCTSDQGGLPYHVSAPAQLHSLVARSLRPLLRALPPPVLVTVARSTEDGYCPPEQVDSLQEMVLAELQDAFDTAEPSLHYLHEANLIG